MKIQYEIGDVVWITYGIEKGRVVAINKQSLVAENEYGERFNIGKREVEPHGITLAKAEWVQP